MKNMLATIEDVKSLAITIKNSIEFCKPDLPEETRNIVLNFKFNRVYNTCNSVIAFVDKDVQYVIPYMRRIRSILENDGYVLNTSIYVPFSQGDYPLRDKKHWNKLKSVAKKQNRLDFIEDCIKYSDIQEYGILEEEHLKKCFEIPKEGIKVKRVLSGTTYYPLLQSFDCSVDRKLGHYCINKAVCVFVYRNGKTYVTCNEKVISALKEAGYLEGDLFVPFSNEEKMQNAYYQNMWEQIKKM